MKTNDSEENFNAILCKKKKKKKGYTIVYKMNGELIIMTLLGSSVH